MPEEAVVLGEGLTGGGVELELRPQPPVGRVKTGVEDRERVGAARQEDGYEHRLSGPRSRARDPFLEQPQLAEAVDREREAEAARDERAPVEPGTCRQRHPGLDRWQPASGLGGAAPHERGAGELVAVVTGARHQEV